MEWVRGDQVGCGSFATVSLAIPRIGDTQFPPLTVVKTCEASCSATLKHEKLVLDRMGDCPQIIRCFGDNYSCENGEELYNLFLEYASGGTLNDQVKRRGGKLPETEVRRYTTSILKGLHHIHSQGFVHCDIKLQNILVFDNGDVKVADFGLAKNSGEKLSTGADSRIEFRGTPLYMSPESVNDNRYDPSSDIWAVGCAVVEMVTGRPVWNCKPGSNIYSLMIRIGVGEELPEIPSELSEEGKDFLRKCFVKNPERRWTAEMLLNHPLLADDDDDTPQRKLKAEDSSPRSHFDLPEWISTATSSVPSSPESDAFFYKRSEFAFTLSLSSGSSPPDRLQELLSDRVPDWSTSDSWVSVR